MSKKRENNFIFPCSKNSFQMCNLNGKSYICLVFNTPCCFACKVSLSYTLPWQMDCNEILIPMQSLWILHFNVLCLPVRFIFFCACLNQTNNHKKFLVSLVSLFKILLWFSFCHISLQVPFVFEIVQLLLRINWIWAINYVHKKQLCKNENK